MPKLKLVSNVSEFGLFQGIAKTRIRLLIATALATAAMLGLGLWSADYVLERSTSVSLNLLLITANMFVMMIAAYMQALTMGDLFFPGPWREQIVLGQRPDLQDPDAELVVRNHNAEFMILLIGLIILNAFLINVSAGGFLDTYHNEGFFRVRLRHEAPAERIEALKDMVEPTQADLWTLPGLHKVVISAITDPSPEVQVQAIWNAGKMNIEAARAPLTALLKDPKTPGPVLAEASLAIGRMGKDFESREAIEAQLKAHQDDPKTLIGALRGLALMKDQDAANAILPFIDHRDKDVVINAYFALREIGAKDVKPALLKRITEKTDLSDQERCALLDTLKMISSPEDIPWAQRQFIRAAPDQKCEHVVWEDRDEQRRYILYYDDVRTKYIKIVANSGGGAEHKRWFELIASDPDEPWSVRETAGLVLKQLNR